MIIIAKYKTFEAFIKEIKKPRREYEKKYIWNTKWYIINKKWKWRERYRDILCWMCVENDVKNILLYSLKIKYYDNHSKISKIIKDQKR